MSAAWQRTRVVLAVLATAAVVLIFPNRPLASAALALLWWLAYRPLARIEVVQFGIAAVFFLFQNYATLRAGLFEFRDKDILLMPVYEPMLWGFYFLSLKRFVAERSPLPGLTWKAIAGLAATSAVFSVFGSDPDALLVASIGSTTLLLVLFHAPADLAWATAALALGFAVELFGVSMGLWSYPAHDVLGIPYWFATMWISAGLLGRRFLLPVSAAVAARLAPQPA